jgi:hypothetical protein
MFHPFSYGVRIELAGLSVYHSLQHLLHVLSILTSFLGSTSFTLSYAHTPCQLLHVSSSGTTQSGILPHPSMSKIRLSNPSSAGLHAYDVHQTPCFISRLHTNHLRAVHCGEQNICINDNVLTLIG